MAGLETSRLGWLEILGLRDPQDSSWRLVQGAQLREFSGSSLLPIVGVLLSAAFVAWQFWGVVPHGLMIAWLSVLALNTLSSAVSRRRNLRLQDGATRADVRRAVRHSAIYALFWAVPPLFFASVGSPEQILLVTTVSLVMMGAATLMLIAVPLAGIVTVCMIGGSLAIMLAGLGLPIFAGIAFSYAICLSYTLLVNGRALIARLCNDLTLDEQRDVVNLLLRQDNGQDSDWLWQIDGRKCIVDPSPRFVKGAGLKAEEIDGMPFFQLLAGADWEKGEVSEEIRQLVTKLQRGETFSEYTLPVKANGEQRWWKISGTPKLGRDRHVTGYRGVIADVTDRQATERQTHRMAHYDGLTRLPNRAHTNRLLHDRIAKAAGDNQPCAFLMIDLDRFKAINDTLGHPVGDRLLEQVARRLSGLAGPADKCGRLGGDEFAMVIAHPRSKTDLNRRARDIILALSKPYIVDEQTLYIGASVGSAVYPGDGRSAPTLLRNADLALYRAKESGRGIHAAYEPALLQKAEERRAIEGALRQALKNGEFHLVYQPVISVDSREIAGFEALLRWTNGELGTISPDRFIPIAEETRLIDPIGEWVFRTACAEAASWPEHYRLAINLSEGQLRNPRLAGDILSALSRSGLDPGRLEVETTESVLNKDNEQALRTFAKLRSLGVTAALDDFGTGYSTLSFIGKARFNSIKIDQNFIRTAQSGSRTSIAIIRAVVAMADSLDISTIVEGVENDAQFTLAKRLGCSQVQGYFLERPMEASAVKILVADRKEAAA